MNSNFEHHLTIRTQRLADEMISSSLATLRATEGTTINKMEDYFALGVLFADQAFGTKTDKEENTHALMASFQNTIFQDNDGNLLAPNTTIGIADLHNKLAAFVVVMAPGVNMVYVLTRSTSESLCRVEVFGEESIVKLMDDFTSGLVDNNEHDRIVIAKMFGLQYDKFNARCIVPTGRRDSGFQLVAKAHKAGLAIGKRIKGE